MENKSESFEKNVEEFYGIHPFTKMVKYIVGPFGGLAPITDYRIDNFNEEKVNQLPSELIEKIFNLTNKKFNNSRLEYSQVRQHHANSLEVPSMAWSFIGLFSKKYQKYKRDSQNFEEFMNLWKASKEADKYLVQGN